MRTSLWVHSSRVTRTVSAQNTRTPPTRTCVGCRERVAKHDLLRVVLVQDKPSTLVPDPQGRAPGRGAHLHPTTACLDLAERRRAFTRALRADGPVDIGELRQYVEAASTKQHQPVVGSTEKESGSSGS